MGNENKAENLFHVGGNVPPNHPTYIERQADTALREALLRGVYCYVLDTRQVGKSSLMDRTAEFLRQKNRRVVRIDLTGIGQTGVTQEQWYGSILRRVREQLGLEAKLDAFWREHKEMGVVERLMLALTSVALPASDEPLTIFIDEIDSVQNLAFGADEFFAAIREVYNRRSDEPPLNNLAFCLLGSATPDALIRSNSVTPYNIGEGIILQDFTRADARPLAALLTETGRDGDKLLQRTLHWSEGHPYLTQKICEAIAKDATAKTPAAVDKIVDRLFTGKMPEDDRHLNTIKKRIKDDEIFKNDNDRAALLTAYQRLYHRFGRLSGVTHDTSDPRYMLLKLAGIVRERDGQLAVRNRIYHTVFGRKWIRANMPGEEMRRQRAAFVRGALAATVVGLIFSGSLGYMYLFAEAQRAVATSASLEKDTALKEKNDALIKKTEALNEKNSALNEKSAALEDKKRALKAQDDTNIALRATQKDLKKKRDEVEDKNRSLKNEIGEKVTALFDLAKKTEEALSNAKQAREATGIAEQEAERSRKMLLRACVASGGDKARSSAPGEDIDSLPWLSTAMNLAAKEPDIHKTCRDLIIMVLNKYPGLIQQVRHPGGAIRSVQFNAAGTRLLTAGEDNTARVWDVQTGAELCQIRHQNAINFACFSPDGRLFATASDDGKARVCNASNGSEIALLNHSKPVRHVAFSQDGNRIVTSSDDESAILCDLKTNKTIVLLCAGKVAHAEFSRDGNWVVTADAFSWDKGGEAVVWDSYTGKKRTAPLRHHGHILWATFSPDGRKVVTASEDATAQIWDAETGKPLTPPLRHDKAVRSAQFSPDGLRVATASEDKTARIWDANNGRMLTPPLRHPGPVDFAAFSSPDGRMVVTADDWQEIKNSEPKGQARLWDSWRGVPLSPPLEHSGATLHADFSADGRWVATAGKDGAARIWKTAYSLRERNGSGSLSSASSINVLTLHARLLSHTLIGPEGLPVDAPAALLKSAHRQAVAEIGPSAPIGGKERSTWYRQEAESCENEGDNGLAVSFLSSLLEANPEDVAVRRRRIAAYTKLERYEECLADYKFLLEQSPREAKLWGERAKVYAAQGHWKQVVVDYNQGLTLTPKSLVFRKARADALTHLGKWREAADAYSNLLAAVSDDDILYAHRGNAYAAMGQRQAAIADFSQAIQLNPKSLYYAYRGDSYASLGRWAEAKADLKRAVEGNVPDIGYWWSYAVLCLRLDDAQGYKSVSQKAWEKFTQGRDERLTALRINLLAPESPVAINMLREAGEDIRTEQKNDPFTLRTLALAYHRENRDEEAMATLNFAAKLCGDSKQYPAWLRPNILLLQAVCSQKQGSYQPSENYRNAAEDVLSAIPDAEIPWNRQTELTLLKKEFGR